MRKLPESFDDMEDLSLWKCMIRGDQKALEILYDRYYALLLNYGLKYSKDRELVKDGIHDVFLNLYHNSRINPQVTVRSYLLYALRNTLFGYFSKEFKTDSLDQHIFYIPENENLFENLFPKDDHALYLGNQLLKAISQLSPRQKNVLYLRYVKELSYKEISDIMGMNVQSSMNLANRALSKLRSLVGTEQEVLLLSLLISIFRI